MFARLFIFFTMMFLPLMTYAYSTDVKLEYGNIVVQNTTTLTDQWTVAGVNGDSSQKVVLLGRLTGSHTGIFQYEFIVFTLSSSAANVIDSTSLENILSQDTRDKLTDGSYLTIRTH